MDNNIELVENYENIDKIKDIWHEVFGDDPKFWDLQMENGFFSSNDLFVLLKDGEVVSSLCASVYSLNVGDFCLIIPYILCVSTKIAHRSKGYMRLLLNFAMEKLKERGYLLTALIPSEESLFNYYEQFGFFKAFYVKKIVFELNKPINVKNVVSFRRLKKNNPVVDQLYSVYQREYAKKTMCCHKSYSQFSALIDGFNFNDSGGAFYNKFGEFMFVSVENYGVVVREYDLCDLDNAVRYLKRKFKLKSKDSVIFETFADDKRFPNGMLKILSEEGLVEVLGNNRFYEIFDNVKNLGHINNMLN